MTNTHESNGPAVTEPMADEYYLGIARGIVRALVRRVLRRVRKKQDRVSA